MLKYNKYDVIFGEFPDRDGSIQSGYRPGIVIQNNICNTYYPTLIAIPLTSKIKNLDQGTHMLIECNDENGLKPFSIMVVQCALTASEMDRNHQGLLCAHSLMVKAEFL